MAQATKPSDNAKGELASHSATTSLSIAKRVSNRAFPSNFAPWEMANNLPKDNETISKYDLFFGGPDRLKLMWNNGAEGISDEFKPESITQALTMRKDLLARNPNIVILAEIRYFDANDKFFGSNGDDPEFKPYWKHDEKGGKIPSFPNTVYSEYMKLDFSNPELQDAIVRRIKALIKTGVVDGIMLDNWKLSEESSERLTILQKIRAEVGNEALIVVNLNDHTIPDDHAPLINGAFMECYRSRTIEDWSRIINTLDWCKRKLASPQIVCLETWASTSNPTLHNNRSLTTLAAVFDSYCLFADNNQHHHSWDNLWSKKFGKPVSEMNIRADGAFERQFEDGIVIHNPVWNKQIQIAFDDNKVNIADEDRLPSKRFILEGGDGGIYMKPSLHNIV